MSKSNLTVPLELKQLDDREFDGHGSVFGNEDLGGDIILPGAFKRTLAKHRKNGTLPQMFWMHDPTRVPGKWLTMSEDDDGLKVKGRLAPTPLGDEIHTLLNMKAVRGLSIGYQTVDQDFDDDGRRLLKELDLWEVSVVSLPMNPLAQVAHAKSQLSKRGEYVPTPKEFERILREAGCTRKVARDIIHLILEQEPLREAEELDPLREAEDKDQRDVDGLDDLAEALRQLDEHVRAETIRIDM